MSHVEDREFFSAVRKGRGENRDSSERTEMRL